MLKVVYYLFKKLSIFNYLLIKYLSCNYVLVPRMRKWGEVEWGCGSGICVNRVPLGPKKQQVKSWVCLALLCFTFVSVDESWNLTLFPIVSLLFLFFFSPFIHFIFHFWSNHFTSSQFQQQQPNAINATFSHLHSIISISNGGIRHCLRRCAAGSNSSNPFSRPQTLRPAPHFSSNAGGNGAPDPPLRPPELEEEENASEAQLRRDPARVEGDRGGECSGAENRRVGRGRSEEEGDEAWGESVGGVAEHRVGTLV